MALPKAPAAGLSPGYGVMTNEKAQGAPVANPNQNKAFNEPMPSTRSTPGPVQSTKTIPV